MPCGILHPMVWDTSVNSSVLILKTIYLFLPCKLIFWKATKVGSPPNVPKLMSQLWGILQPQYFVTSLSEPHRTYFWKHYIYQKEDSKVGSQNLATKFDFVPDCWASEGTDSYTADSMYSVYLVTQYMPAHICPKVKKIPTFLPPMGHIIPTNAQPCQLPGHHAVYAKLHYINLGQHGI